MEALDTVIAKLVEIFKTNNSRYEAHQKVAPILEKMAKNQSFLFNVVKRNLSKEGFFDQKRINPVLAFQIFENKDFSFVAHAFMPLPNRNTDITHQSIHHHGNLLLSTINCFGEGYESILFKKGYKITDKEALLKVDKKYVNKLYNYEFIDSHSPHIVYYPKEITITYALWSNEKVSASDGLKKLGVLQKYKGQLRKLIQNIGAESLFNLNKIEYMDFYVKDGKVIPMKERVRYPEATNVNYIYNLFYLLQKIDFKNEALIQELVDQMPDDRKTLIEPILNRYKANEPLIDSLDDNQYGIQKVNIHREELEKAFPTNG